MAGTALDRKLGTRFAVATVADDVAIRRLLRDTPMHGAISLSLEREPDYFRGANVAGGEDQTIVAFADDRLACMGRCTRREYWVNGSRHRVGYLSELRLDAAARGRFRVLRDGYRFFEALERDDPANMYFTSVAADNERARRVLESGARGLPAYRFLAELDTLAITVPRRAEAGQCRVEKVTPERLPELVRVLNEHGKRHDLAAVWTVERLRELARHGLPIDRFFVAIEAGKVVACSALWDQRGFRQTVVRGYSRSLAAVRPALNFASKFFGTLRLPAPGSVLAHAFLSPLVFVSGAEGMLPEFIEAIFPIAASTGVDFLTLALPAPDPRLSILRRRFSTRVWRSRLYQVEWGDRLSLSLGSDATILPDLALL